MLKIFVAVFVFAAAVMAMVPGAEAVFWNDPAGYGQGWYDITSDFTLTTLAGGNADDMLYDDYVTGNAPGGSCLRSFSNGAESQGATVYASRSGFSPNAIYTLRFTGLGGTYGIQNFTVSVKNASNIWVNYSRISYTDVGFWDANTSTHIRDGGHNGLGIPVFVNLTGIIDFTIWSNFSASPGVYSCHSGLNVTNFTSGFAVENITINSPVNTTYFENSFPINFTAMSLTLSSFPCWIALDGNVTSIGNVSSGLSWQNVTQNGTSYHNLTVICGFGVNTTNTTYFTTWANRNNVSIQSSMGWSLSDGESSVINCTAQNGSASLFRDGIGITNPYSSTFSYGSHNFTCTSSSNITYGPGWDTQTMAVGVGISDCTDNSTFVWSSVLNFNTTTGNATISMAQFVSLGYIWHDLRDVNVTNATQVFRNGTNLILNTTHNKTVTIRFGNHFVNNTFSAGTNSGPLYPLPSYNQSEPYVKVALNMEDDEAPGLPPQSNTSIILGCDAGTTMFTNISNTTLYIPTFRSKFDYVKAVTTYSDGSSYFRQNVIDSAIENVDMYMADATIYTVLQIPLVMLDAGYYGDLITVYKPSGGSTIIITEGYFDVENKFTAYLIKDETYMVRMRHNGALRIIGFLYATAAGEQTISISQISTVPDVKLIHDYLQMGAEKVGATLQISYADFTNLTESVRIRVWENRTIGTPLYDATILDNDAISVTLNGMNATSIYAVLFTVEHEEFGNSPIDQLVTTGSLGLAFNFGLGAGHWALGAIGFVISMFVAFMASPRVRIGVHVVLGITIILVFTFGWTNFTNAGDTSGLAIAGLLAVMLALSVLYQIKQVGDT